MQRLFTAVLRTTIDEAHSKNILSGCHQLISLRSFIGALGTASSSSLVSSLEGNGTATAVGASASGGKAGFSASSGNYVYSNTRDINSSNRSVSGNRGSQTGSSSSPPRQPMRTGDHDRRTGYSHNSSRAESFKRDRDQRWGHGADYSSPRQVGRRSGYIPGNRTAPHHQHSHHEVGGGEQRSHWGPGPQNTPARQEWRPKTGVDLTRGPRNNSFERDARQQQQRWSSPRWEGGPSGSQTHVRRDNRNSTQQRSFPKRRGPIYNGKSNSNRNTPPGVVASRAAKRKEPEVTVIPSDVTIVRLAQLLGVSVKDVEKVLTDLGESPSSEEDNLSADSAELAALELGKSVVIAPAARKAEAAAAAAAVPRPAVVAVMGHVDHGKTTLLESLRSTSVASREAGGITQHVGAFEVSMSGSGSTLTFLDTPGHAAFSAMRARGAQITDLVVLVVAADDGVMPQTREALTHARSAGCPIVVAITKCDVPAADPDRVRRQLLAEGLLLEGLGGSIQVIEVAAMKGEGLVELEEALFLEGEMLKLSADPGAPATATVVEARLDRGQGPIATVIVTGGTLKVGQPVVVGTEWGKVRALSLPGGLGAVGNNGVSPGRPAELTGLKGVPFAGEALLAVATEERAQRVSKARKTRSEMQRHEALGKSAAAAAHVDGIEGPRMLPLLIKADVQGSVEAVRQSAESLSTDFVKIQVVHVGVGPISKSDVALAAPFGAKVIGFNVRAAAEAETEAKSHGVGIHCRRIIYEILQDIEALVDGATPKQLEDVTVGSAEVLAVFKVPGKKGSQSKIVAGCRVGDGALRTGLRIRVLRGGEVVHESACTSLRRHKLDVDTVGRGTECGIGLEGFDDFRQGDVLQAVDQQ